MTYFFSIGHSAQYCTYTTMEHDSKDIISVVTVDKRLTNLNSVVMEKHAFIQTFDQLLGELNITEIVTDAHMQISALLSEYIFINFILSKLFTKTAALYDYFNVYF